MPGLAIGHSHGGIRGAEPTTHSPFFEGRFGRMFRRLRPATFSEAALHTLATPTLGAQAAVPTPVTKVDKHENQVIAGGYKCLRQFTDTALTFDPARSLMKHDDPDALVVLRNPPLDLDSIYGRSPEDQPY